MLHIQAELKFSDYQSLYNILIPSDSKSRQLNELINFTLIRKELSGNYSKDMGCVAVDPVMLFKYLLLKPCIRLPTGILCSFLYGYVIQIFSGS